MEKETLIRGNFLKLSRLAFSHYSELKINMETHTEEQAFSCKNCGLAFSQHSCLKSHMRTHQSKKAFFVVPVDQYFLQVPV